MNLVARAPIAKLIVGYLVNRYERGGLPDKMSGLREPEQHFFFLTYISISDWIFNMDACSKRLRQIQNRRDRYGTVDQNFVVNVKCRVIVVVYFDAMVVGKLITKGIHHRLVIVSLPCEDEVKECGVVGVFHRLSMPNELSYCVGSSRLFRVQVRHIEGG
jgi:hypothetical protein